MSLNLLTGANIFMTVIFLLLAISGGLLINSAVQGVRTGKIVLRRGDVNFYEKPAVYRLMITGLFVGGILLLAWAFIMLWLIWVS